MSVTIAEVVELWHEKRRFFLREEAIEADPARKFQIQQHIKEAQRKIEELQRDDNLAGDDLSHFARQVTSGVLSARFVDLMRMLFVCSVRSAREVNIQRYPAFVKMAEEHAEEFHLQSGKSPNLLPEDLKVSGARIDGCFMVMLSFIRKPLKPEANFDIFFDQMADIASRVYSYCHRAIGEDYGEILSSVEAAELRAFDGHVSMLRWSDIDELSRLRLRIQSNIIKGEAARARGLHSIADDMDYILALQYFVVDYRLLTGVHTQAGPD